MIDPGEIRWADGFVRIGFLGADRWRVSKSDDLEPRELSREALIAFVLGALEALPRGLPHPVPGSTSTEALDLGMVTFTAPRACDRVRVVWRADLATSESVVDVVALDSMDGERAYHAPLAAYATHWLASRSERCRAVGLPLPPDRLGPEYAASSFDDARDRDALARRLEVAIRTWASTSGSIAEAFDRAVHELDALGHDCSFADEDGGSWKVWASRHLVVRCRYGESEPEESQAASDLEIEVVSPRSA